MVESYLNVFKRIFEKTRHIAHYNMMMGEPETTDGIETVEAVTPLS
jgi:hypothetical protein